MSTAVSFDLCASVQSDMCISHACAGGCAGATARKLQAFSRGALLTVPAEARTDAVHA